MENVKRKITEYNKALKLKGRGYSNVKISKELDVSEKTLSKWIRNSPTIKAQKAQAKLLERLEREADILSSDEVARISDSVVKLNKIAFPE